MPSAISGLLILLSLFFMWPNEVKAANFNQVSVRTDRQKVSQPTSALVCADPASGGTEDKVEVTFPLAFNVNSSAGNWTVNTSNLPSGAIAWPGIGTASSVSSKTVTFPSGDLTSGNLYCFNFSSTNTLTNPASVGTDLRGSIITKDNSNTEIDNSNFSLTASSNDQVSINAVVAEDTNAYTTSLTSPSGTAFNQGATINYTITYGSNTSQTNDVTLQASWTQGTISGTSSNVEILQYVVGSATNGYNGTVPVIDTVNRTITWTIPNFPGITTGQTVNFSLQTTSNYTGSQTVNFSVSSKIITSQFSTTPSTLNQSYNYSPPGPGPSPSPTSGGSTTAPSGSPSPVPSSAGSVKPAIESISIKEITKSSALINVVLNQQAKVILSYGTSIGKLDKTITSLSDGLTQEIRLESLLPDTIYYFRVQAVNSAGSIRSDLFTFKTAKDGSTPEIFFNRIMVISRTNFLTYQSADPDSLLNVILPQEENYEFRVPIGNYAYIKKVEAYIRRKDVLGVSTSVFPSSETQRFSPDKQVTQMLEIFPGTFSGFLKTPTETGYYEVVLKIEDNNGNLLERPIFNLRSVKPLKVIDAETKRPLEAAQIKFYFFNPRTQIYEYLSPQSIAINNPVLTNPDGQAGIVLPQGKFRAELVALGYKEKQVDFEIGPEEGKEYPEIGLVLEGFNLGTYFKYYSSILENLSNEFTGYLSNIRDSQRVFNLFELLTVINLVVLGTVFFKKNRLMIFYWISRMRSSKGVRQISGNLIDKETKKGIVGALVFLTEEEGLHRLMETTSGKSGGFSLRLNTDNKEVKLVIIKQGYQMEEKVVDLSSDIKDLDINLKLEDEAVSEVVKEDTAKVVLGLSYILYTALLLWLAGTSWIFIAKFGAIASIFFGINLVLLFGWLLLTFGKKPG